jgi:hypothetical protein
MDIGVLVPSLLMKHPHVKAVRLTGSREHGRLHGLSDWDFAVETDDFDSVAAGLPELVAPLQPIAAAITDYLDARGALELEFGLKVPRQLEQEVRPAVLRSQRSDAPSAGASAP